MKVQLSTLTLALGLASTALAGPFQRRQTTAASSTKASISTTSASSTKTKASATAKTNSSSIEPCAVASMMSASIASLSPAVTLPPSVALACLHSVPLDKERDMALIDYLTPYADLQSTLPILKDPPQGYLLPGVDVIGGLAQIKTLLGQGHYKNQYMFAVDLRNIFLQAHDGHYDYAPQMLNAFFFFRSIQIASISDDGVALPKVYITTDVAKKATNASVSHITHIDGMPVQNYLEKHSVHALLQDPDALYNTLFDSAIAQSGQGQANAFEASGAFGPAHFNDQTNITFANCTTQSFPNFAVVAMPLNGIDTGDKFHSVIELGSTLAASSTAAPSTTAAAPTSAAATTAVQSTSTSSAANPPSTSAATSASTTTTSAAATSAAATSAAATSVAATSVAATSSQTKATATSALPRVRGYPSPVVIHSDKYISGYFLDDANNKDTAVLSLFAFEGTDASNAEALADLTEFRQVVTNFLAMCGSAGKKKLVIDLQGNGGGLVENGYELFIRLFPNTPLLDVDRFRITDKSNWMLTEVSSFTNGIIAANGSAFRSRQDLIGPVPFKGGNYSNPVKFNFSDPNGILSDEIKSNSTIPPSPFTADNIVVVTDGSCASTCTLFTGLMMRAAGVRTIALGGRAIDQPMQAIGGTKGATSLSYSTVVQVITLAKMQNVTTPSFLPSIDPAPMLPEITSISFNWKNGYLRADDPTPVQFVYEPANCKVFFTADMYKNITGIWQKAANVAFNGGSCVCGSSPTGKATNKTMPFTPAVMAKFANIGGPGSLCKKTANKTPKIRIKKEKNWYVPRHVDGKDPRYV